MTEPRTKNEKKNWNQPMVKPVANVAETRGGVLLTTFENNPVYSS